MRLINTSTLELAEFYDSDIPNYAILSHTWGKEEVSYQEWSNKSSLHKAGYKKIEDFCKICHQNQFEWAWVDTCCIDKTSSAELSEAINSMYRWYRGRVCYAYLVDVPHNDFIQFGDSTFRSSRWFTRGWTLQELIAPRVVHFFNEAWVEIAQRKHHSVILSSITGIPSILLRYPDCLFKFSAAQKMSWASKRKTTRKEDIAYCLMGLFDVNMPLLYGEGDKAFLRLQEEIMKLSSDHTLFAWASVFNGRTFLDSGLLAPSPEYFAGSSRLVKRVHSMPQRAKPYSLTNQGIEIELLLGQPQDNRETRMAFLNCGSEESPSKNAVIILARSLVDSIDLSERAMAYEGDYIRKHCHKLEFLNIDSVELSLQQIYVQRGGAMFRSYSAED